MKLMSLILCFLLTFLTEVHSHVELLIKFPTRSRPERFFKTLDLYYSKLSGNISYHFVISCDHDDETMNNFEVIEKLKNYPFLSYYFGNNKSKIEACNADLENHLDFDVLLLASDDMIPKAQGYDQIIVRDMVQFFPEFDGLLHYADGHVGNSLCTLPVIGKNFYTQFNYIYHPDYRSLYCDYEMTLVSRAMNKYTYIDFQICEHEHYTFYRDMKDDLYIKNDGEAHRDSRVFGLRQGRNFPLWSVEQFL